MKQLSKALVLGASICTAALTVCAEEAVKHEVQTVNFDEFRTAVYCPGKADNIKNGRIIYAVKGKGIPASYIMFRGAVGDKYRVDIVTATDVFTACRNGEAYWGYDKENGRVELTAEDAAEMRFDTPFYPFPFQKNNYYAPLTPSGTGVFRTSECTIFETKPLIQADFSLSVWVDNASERLCMISSEGEDGVFSTSFRNYKDFDGVELATRINMSAPDGVAAMILKSAEWNVEFPKDVFDKEGSLEKDARVLELQKYLASVDAKNAAMQKATDDAKAATDKAKQEAAEERVAKRKSAQQQKQIDGLKKEIERLKLEIEEKSQYLAPLEEYIRANIDSSMETAKEYARKPYHYRRTWNYRGWGHWSRTSNSKQRRLAKNFYKEAKASGKEYDKVSREVNALRLQLSDAQAQLEKLEAAQATEAKAAQPAK